MSKQITWKIIRGNINDHLVWMESSNGTKALFKQPRDQGSFKLVEIANELIVYQLALRLGIPVSETYIEIIDGKIGIMSIIRSELNWSYITSQNLQNKVLNIDLFKQLFAFDVFVANIDRSTGKNEHVIVIQTANGYVFYAIDHGHTLNGCTQGEKKWQLENVADQNKFPLNNLNHLSESMIRNLNDLEPMIEKIEILHDGTIDNIVDSICLLVSCGRSEEEKQALANNCNITKVILKLRRDSLRLWLRNWCADKGK